ncbi:hypothetical protein HAX54_044521, partial [Datura stramonium]|nr:hypothetical protein [Datura stramonium]
ESATPGPCSPQWVHRSGKMPIAADIVIPSRLPTPTMERMDYHCSETPMASKGMLQWACPFQESL